MGELVGERAVVIPFNRSVLVRNQLSKVIFGIAKVPRFKKVKHDAQIELDSLDLRLLELFQKSIDSIGPIYMIVQVLVVRTIFDFINYFIFVLLIVYDSAVIRFQVLF